MNLAVCNAYIYMSDHTTHDHNYNNNDNENDDNDNLVMGSCNV